MFRSGEVTCFNSQTEVVQQAVTLFSLLSTEYGIFISLCFHVEFAGFTLKASCSSNVSPEQCIQFSPRPQISKALFGPCGSLESCKNGRNVIDGALFTVFIDCRLNSGVDFPTTQLISALLHLIVSFWTSECP